MKIKLLRLGHRIHRDHRTTTHCALVARAFGSSEMYYCGNEDDSLQSSIEKPLKKLMNLGVETSKLLILIVGNHS